MSKSNSPAIERLQLRKKRVFNDKSQKGLEDGGGYETAATPYWFYNCLNDIQDLS